MVLRLYRFALGVLFSSSDEKRYQKRQPQETLSSAKGFLTYLPKEGGAFSLLEAKMRGPNEAYLKPRLPMRFAHTAGLRCRLAFLPFLLAVVSFG